VTGQAFSCGETGGSRIAGMHFRNGSIEWAIERSLALVELEEQTPLTDAVSLADAARIHRLWDLDEPDRIVRLALNYPDLLTHEEQMVWKLVRENGLLWKGRYDGAPPEWTWKIAENSIVWDTLRKHWQTFRAVASGSQPGSSLPVWQKRMPPRVGSRGDLDDKIPF